MTPGPRISCNTIPETVSPCNLNVVAEKAGVNGSAVIEIENRQVISSTLTLDFSKGNIGNVDEGKSSGIPSIDFGNVQPGILTSAKSGCFEAISILAPLIRTGTYSVSSGNWDPTIVPLDPFATPSETAMFCDTCTGNPSEIGNIGGSRSNLLSHSS